MHFFCSLIFFRIKKRVNKKRCWVNAYTDFVNQTELEGVIIFCRLCEDSFYDGKCPRLAFELSPQVL